VGRKKDSPIIIFLAVDVPVAGEASQLGVQRELALAALEAGGVPLPVHRQEVVSVLDAAPAAGARRPVQHGGAPQAGARRGDGAFDGLALLQHLDGGGRGSRLALRGATWRHKKLRKVADTVLTRRGGESVTVRLEVVRGGARMVGATYWRESVGRRH
jgi:hypothetical protein